MDKYLYIFLDESGNLDFSRTGTRYFILAAVTKERPFHAYRDLYNLKYNLIEKGEDREHFHATEDSQSVRNDVFGIISKHIDGIRVDSLIVEKCKIAPEYQAVEKFYPICLGYLLRHIVKTVGESSYKQVIVITDQIPVQKKRQAIIKGIKTTLAATLSHKSYRALHHDSKSCFDLQIADYCTWAIYKKWDQGEMRPYEIIKSAIKSEIWAHKEGAKDNY